MYFFFIKRNYYIHLLRKINKNLPIAQGFAVVRRNKLFDQFNILRVQDQVFVTADWARVPRRYFTSSLQTFKLCVS
jgi:hypothetical protein